MDLPGNTNQATELAEALLDLERRCGKLEPPSEPVAGRVLTALGLYLLEGNLQGVDALLDRIRATTGGCQAEFEAAVGAALESELRAHLARCRELEASAQGPDSGQVAELDSARERLEGTRMGANALGCELDAPGAADLERADRLLESWLNDA